MKRISLLLILTIIFQSCAGYRPATLQEAGYVERIQFKEDGKVRVGVSALSAQESNEIFGASLARNDVQPVWIQIENRDDAAYLFLQRGVHPEYYSPEEAAFLVRRRAGPRFVGAGFLSIFFLPVTLAFMPFHYSSARRANEEIQESFYDQSIQNQVIMPGDTVQGFVFTPFDEGVKKIRVRLVGDTLDKDFAFAVTVPGIKADYHGKIDLVVLPEGETVSITEADLEECLQGIKAFPCCTTNKKGTKDGDPFNIVFLGDFETILSAFAATGWDITEPITFGSVWRMTLAFIKGHRYRYSPISPLYFEGRAQDVAFQKVRQTINERMHIRLWRTKYRLENTPIWIAAVSRDIGVRFTPKTWHLSTHKIDSNVDDAREYTIVELADERRVRRYAFQRGTEPSLRDNPRKNLTGDPYFTDGLRLFVELSEEPVEAVFFGWEFPYPMDLYTQKTSQAEKEEEKGYKKFMSALTNISPFDNSSQS